MILDIPMRVTQPLNISQLTTESFARPTNNQCNLTNVFNMGNKYATQQNNWSYNKAQQQNWTTLTPLNLSGSNNTQQSKGTGVKLKKGQKVSLSNICKGLDLIHVGIGWDLGVNGRNYDLDVEAFLVDQSYKIIGDDWFVFYNQPNSPDNSVRLLCDSTDGAGDGDDEILQIQLSKVSSAVKKIIFIVSINEAKEYGYNFSNVQNAYVRIMDLKTNKELVRFDLTDYYSNVNSMIVGELYLHNQEWKFNPIGDGVNADLTDLCIRYGVNVDD